MAPFFSTHAIPSMNFSIANVFVCVFGAVQKWMVGGRAALTPPRESLISSEPRSSSLLFDLAFYIFPEDYQAPHFAHLPLFFD